MLDYLHLKTFENIPVCVYDPFRNSAGAFCTKKELTVQKPNYVEHFDGKKDGEKTALFTEHTHKEVEITLIADGIEHIVINGEERVLSPGDLYIVNPFDRHSGFYYHQPDAYPI